MKVKIYNELIVWQKSMDLVEQVYSATRDFPREEIYALTNQLRRASVSIASNIAEGQGRRTTADFGRHLSIAYGSLYEAETQILISQRLNYLGEGTTNSLLQMTAEVGRLLNGLMRSLRR
jgi:four helix bundle protein